MQELGNRKSLAALSADSLIVAETALPDESRPHPRKQEPVWIAALAQVRPLLIGRERSRPGKTAHNKTAAIHHRLERRRHDVDGKHLPAAQ
jgi:hypothetical protein